MQYLKLLLKNKILLSIFLLGSFLRFYKLGDIPSGFYVDEAVIGYNAFSFIETGFKDEYGKFLPVFLRSFVAYSSPLYTYLTVLPIKLFGLSVFSTRFLSSFSGSLSIIAIYYLTNTLFSKKNLSLVSALVFAISPWSIFFSRGAYEANFALLILILSIIFLIKEKYIFASILMSINTYAYQAQRLNAFFLLTLFGIYLLQKNRFNFKKILFNKKILISIILFILLQTPQLVLLNKPAFTSRAAGLFYSDIATTPLSFAREFFAQYFNYFSPNNLFITGDQDLQRSIPELSTFYSWMVLPYLLGIYILFKNIKTKNYKIIFALFLLFPIVPALTRDPFSTLRNLSSIIPITIIISLGINNIYLKTNKKLFMFVSCVLLLVSCLYLWRSYFVLLPYERSKIWNYGYIELSEIIIKNPDQKYLIENSRLKPPYILLSFFMQIDPEIMQTSVDQSIKNNYYENTVWNSEYKLLNFETRNINWEEDIYKEQVLVGDKLAISEEQAKEHFLEKQFEIKTKSGETVFVGFKTNPKQKCESIKINKPQNCS